MGKRLVFGFIGALSLSMSMYTADGGQRRAELDRQLRYGRIGHLVNNAEARGHDSSLVFWYSKTPTYAEVVAGKIVHWAAQGNFRCSKCNRSIVTPGDCPQ